MIKTSEEYLAQLKAVGAGDGSIDNIAYVALILASLDRPGISFQKYEHHLKILTLDIEAQNIHEESAKKRAKILSNILYVYHQYTGNIDHYDDLQNTNLMSVIDNRTGLPVSLSILYMHVARSQGWYIEGVKFPRHFLLRLCGGEQDRGGPVIIDPFNNGKILEASDLREMIKDFSDTEYPDIKGQLIPKYYEPMTDQEILVRLLNNIKVRCLKVSDLGQAISILERLVVIDPLQMVYHYELGMLLAFVKKNERAKDILTYCIEKIEQFEPNDLIEQQIINVLKDIERQDSGHQKSNIFKLPIVNNRND